MTSYPRLYRSKEEALANKGPDFLVPRYNNHALSKQTARGKGAATCEQAVCKGDCLWLGPLAGVIARCQSRLQGQCLLAQHPRAEAAPEGVVARCRRRVRVSPAQGDNGDPLDKKKESLEHHCKKERPLMTVPTKEPKLEDMAFEPKEKDTPQSATHMVLILVGYTNSQKLKIKGILEQQPIIILIDTVSTHNFMSSKDATRLIFQKEDCSGFEVKISYDFHNFPQDKIVMLKDFLDDDLRSTVQDHEKIESL
ncbi:hypothetical protein BHM03_00013901 [Ensete ventricosum]|nr:hypothetical protein BHM03_00013901 [Ensete ventricosum]